MKRVAVGTLCGMLALVIGAVPAAGQERAFEGRILDSHCAPSGSHDAAKKTHGLTTDLQCALHCVNFSNPKGKFALVETSSKTVYTLEDEGPYSTIAPYASGGAVKVTGTLNAATKTIKVSKIESTMRAGS